MLAFPNFKTVEARDKTGNVMEINIGDRYGKLTIMSKVESNQAPHPGRGKGYVCKCDCGATRFVYHHHLVQGRVTSCGCKKTRHGQGGVRKRTREFVIWTGMVQRCSNPNAKGYSYYGGRGISVCDRWRLFENFFEDMGRAPQGYSLDRKDNNGNYSKNNCKWSTLSEQQSNKGTTRLYSYDGANLTATQWARRLKLPAYIVRYHLSHYNIARLHDLHSAGMIRPRTADWSKC